MMHLKAPISALFTLCLLAFAPGAFAGVCGEADLMTRGGIVKAWAERPELQKSYKENVPDVLAGEKFRELLEQNSSGPRHLHDRMGWTIQEKNTYGNIRNILGPKDMASWLSTVNVFPASVPEETRIYAAVKFINNETNEGKWFRLGVDMPPSASQWTYKDPGEISHREYMTMLPNGLFPMSFKMFYHDFAGHLLPMWRNPKMMAAIRKYFQQPSAMENAHNEVDLLTEFLSLPEIKHEATIKSLFAKSFASPAPVTPDEVHSSYGGLNQQREKIDYLIKHGQALIGRYGGAVSGHDDLMHPQPEQIGNDAYTLRSVMASSFYPDEDRDNRGPLGAIAVGGIHYLLFELRYIDQKLKERQKPDGPKYWDDWFKGDSEAMLTERLLKRLAIIEAIFVNAVKLQIRPEMVIEFVINGRPAGSAVDRFLRSYLQPNSIWTEILLQRE